MTRHDADARALSGSSVLSRVREFLATHVDAVFLRSEFELLGSSRQVGRALVALVAEGALVKLGLGIYAKAKRSVLSGKPIPLQPLEVLAPVALAKLGVTLAEAPLVSLYNSGKSQQVPVGVVFDTGVRRVKRRVGFNGKYVEFVQTTATHRRATATGTGSRQTLR